MPPRSRCENCRLAQRLCDQKRPRCSRCETKSKSCTYQEATSFQFVNQNSFSAELCRRAARSRDKTPLFVDLDATPLISRNVSPQWPGDETIAPLPQSLETRILDRFFSRWMKGATCLGSQPFLSRLYKSSTNDDALKSAVIATAYADLAVFDRHGSHAKQSLQAYQVSLSRLRSYFNDCSQFGDYTSHMAYAAILALDSFEVCWETIKDRA